MPTNKVKLAPSILSADFARLGEVVAETTRAGVDYIHVDVMDGKFVPNLTIGPMVVDAIRPYTSIPLDVHLMVIEPELLLPDFIAAGANVLTVHQEAVTHLHRTIHQIKGAGVQAGVSINPSTPVSVLEDILPDLDLVLVMSVNPGFGGQKFISNILPKVRYLRKWIDDAGLQVEVEVDGGITPSNVGSVVEAGATIIVAGSAIYATGRPVPDTVSAFREAIQSSRI